jgi:hypothetical protein
MKSGTHAHPTRPSRSDILYSDRLVEISEEGILFRKYYLPILSARFVPFSEINHIDIRKPMITTGKWRIGGTGFPCSIWFPFDWQRPSRDRIFRAALKNGRAIGFTVEDSARVIDILGRVGMIVPVPA